MSKAKPKRSFISVPVPAAHDVAFRHFLRLSLSGNLLRRRYSLIDSYERAYLDGYIDSLQFIIDLLDSYVFESDSDSSQEVR